VNKAASGAKMCSVYGTGVLQTRPSGPLRAPARRIFLKGNRVGIGRASPLREMTSAAYGVGRNSIADAPAVRCPVSAFFVTPVVSGDLLDEECCTRHAPSGRGAGALPKAGIAGSGTKFTNVVEGHRARPGS